MTDPTWGNNSMNSQDGMNLLGVASRKPIEVGGWLENPTYADTHHSKSGHAEAIRVTFDPAMLSYKDLLETWFFKLHDPTTLNRQGYDAGTQYRSAIFPQTPNSAWLKGCVTCDGAGFIKTGTDLSKEDLEHANWPLSRPPYLLETSLPGVFAVGDVRGGNVKRVASAVGEGSIAVSFVHQVLAE